MRQLTPLLLVLLASAAGVAAQERIAPPPPEPVQSGPPSTGPGAIVIPEHSSSVLPAPSTSTPPTYIAPDGSGPFPPYPPTGIYDNSPYPTRAGFVDPVDPNVWFGVDALIWWSRRQPLPPNLVTTGPASAGSNAGGLGVAGTTSLTQPIDIGTEGGVQFYGGGWFTPAHKLGMEGSLFVLGSRGGGWSVVDRSGTGSFVINEPVAGAPFVTQVSAPGVQTGGVFVDSTSRFWGGDLNVLYNLFRNNGMSLNLLAGFRAVELRETLSIAANSELFLTTTYSDGFGNVLATADPGSVVSVVDHFGTRNQFYGGQIGAQLQFTTGRWIFDGIGKLAIGSTHETININGDTAIFPLNANPVFLSGGNYATLQSGHYSSNKFAVLPSMQLRVGYQFAPCLRGTLGYNFMYLSNVVRPGNQIDNTFDGVSHPTVPFAQSGYWTQGITIGLQLIF
jgi:hypothetical protein